MNKLLEDIKRYIPYNEQEKVDREVIIDLINKNNDILNRSSKDYHLTASSWIVNETFDKILLIYHNLYDSWSWTGGHADGDSNLLNVAIKEAKEETGITNIYPLSKDIYSLEILAVDGHIKKNEYVNSHLHLNITYLLCASSNDELKIKPDENSNVSWFNIDEVVDKSSEKWFREHIYSKLNEKLKEYIKGKK